MLEVTHSLLVNDWKSYCSAWTSPIVFWLMTELLLRSDITPRSWSATPSTPPTGVVPASSASAASVVSLAATLAVAVASLVMMVSPALVAAAISPSSALVVVSAALVTSVLSVAAVTAIAAASVTSVVTLVVISSVEAGGAEGFAVEFLFCLPVWSVGSSLGALNGLARYAVEERLGLVVAWRLAVGLVQAGGLAALVVVGDLALLNLDVGRHR